MREILFRGKFGNEWKYGYLSVEPQGLVIKEPYIGNKSEIWHIDPETVGQYTCLTDKNGRKIFEGDIVKYRNDIMVIMYDNITLCFEMCYAQYYSSNWNCNCGGLYGRITANKKVEVIGNVFDNPEMLEVKK